MGTQWWQLFQPIHSVLPHGNTNDNCPNPYTVCCPSAYPAPQRSLPSEWPAHMLLCQNRAAQIISTFSRGETAPCPPESFRPSLGKASLPTARPTHASPLMDPKQKQRNERLCLLTSACFPKQLLHFWVCVRLSLASWLLCLKAETVPFLQQRIP